MKGTPQSSLCSSCQSRTQQENGRRSAALKRVFISTRPSWHPDLRRPASRTGRRTRLGSVVFGRRPDQAFSLAGPVCGCPWVTACVVTAGNTAGPHPAALPSPTQNLLSDFQKHVQMCVSIRGDECCPDYVLELQSHVPEGTMAAPGPQSTP